MGDGGGVKIGDPPQKQYQTVVLQVIRRHTATKFFMLIKYTN